jgi:hypothetical protein
LRAALIAIGLVSTLALTGCQTMTASQSTVSLVNEKLAKGREMQEQCINQIVAENPDDFAIVESQVAALRQTASNKVVLMANKNKISPQQKTALLNVLNANTKCRMDFLTASQGTPVFEPTMDYYGRLDILYSKLLQGDLTIGEFNTENELVRSQARARIDQSILSYNSMMADAHYREVEQRQRAAAVMLPYLAQQQAIQQQNMYNQQMLMLQQQQNMMLNQPVNTNCTQYGNQINCRSW